LLAAVTCAAGAMREKAKRADLDQARHFQVFFSFY